LEFLLFAASEVITGEKDELQCAVNNLQITASGFDMSLSVKRDRGLLGKGSVRNEICISNKTL
jgi:hypothetical protein